VEGDGSEPSVPREDEPRKGAVDPLTTADNKAPHHDRPAGGGRWIRTLGPPATVELGSAGGARRDRCHPGTPIVRVDKLGERFPHAWRAFHMDKSRRLGELKPGPAASAVKRRRRA
jgi:hypothetical protein